MISGTLNKMTAQLGEPIEYAIPVGDDSLPLNQQLGQTLSLRHTGNIYCTYCGRKTKKSFSQGYCFPCMRSLARCDTCIIKPEQCHFDQGTCREPDWAQTHCFRPHYVYLANSSGVKVGITRDSQIPTRWIDQGAIQALPVLKVQSRYQAGLAEVAIAKWVSDKTNWRTMLKGEVEPLDLPAIRDELLEKSLSDIRSLQQQFQDQIEILSDTSVTELHYPVLEYPSKIKSHNFDKEALVEGTLMGIKGQYLMFDTGVINIRKFTSYEIETAI